MTQLTDALFSKLRHDLRSKINVATGYCDLVAEALDESSMPASVSTDLGVIRRACFDLVVTATEIERAMQDPEPWTGKQKALTDILRSLVDPMTYDDATEHFEFHCLGVNVDAALEETVRSVATRAMLAFDHGCRFDFDASIEGSLSITVTPAGAPDAAIEAFASRYRGSDSADPKHNFELFFARRTSGIESLKLASSATDLTVNVVISTS